MQQQSASQGIYKSFKHNILIYIVLPVKSAKIILLLKVILLLFCYLTSMREKHSEFSCDVSYLPLDMQ